MVKETVRPGSCCSRPRFFVSIPSRGSGKGDADYSKRYFTRKEVSIPSRGSGKGDRKAAASAKLEQLTVSIPSRGSGKGDLLLKLTTALCLKVSIPSRGSGKGDSRYVIVPLFKEVSIPSRGGKGDLQVT